MGRYADNIIRAGQQYLDDAASFFRGTCSFSADTLVATPDGMKSISDIQVGDLVLGSYVNGSEIETEEYVVTATYKQHHETTLDLTINGEIMHTTNEHPFLVADGDEYRWIEAQHLNIGDLVLKADGSTGIVEAVAVVDEPQVMYNLTVALAHTFVVGENGWVVHNQSLFDEIPLDELIQRIQWRRGHVGHLFTGIANPETFGRLNNMEQEFVDNMLRQRSNFRLYRTSETHLIGDFLAIDFSAQSRLDRVGWVVELKPANVSAGNQLQNAGELAIRLNLRDYDTTAGTAAEVFTTICNRGRGDWR